MPLRSAGYTQEEDKFLCQVYMEISQDPITGVYQTSDQFWSRVAYAYEAWEKCKLEWTYKKIHSLSNSNYWESNKEIPCMSQTMWKQTSKWCFKWWYCKCFMITVIYILLILYWCLFILNWNAVWASQINVCAWSKIQRRLEIRSCVEYYQEFWKV